MKIMSIFISIPPSILWDHLIVGMLSIRDLALLDIALANNEIRSKLKVGRLAFPCLIP